MNAEGLQKRMGIPYRFPQLSPLNPKDYFQNYEHSSVVVPAALNEHGLLEAQHDGRVHEDKPKEIAPE